MIDGYVLLYVLGAVLVAVLTVCDIRRQRDAYVTTVQQKRKAWR